MGTETKGERGLYTPFCLLLPHPEAAPRRPLEAVHMREWAAMWACLLSRRPIPPFPSPPRLPLPHYGLIPAPPAPPPPTPTAPLIHPLGRPVLIPPRLLPPSRIVFFTSSARAPVQHIPCSPCPAPATLQPAPTLFHGQTIRGGGRGAGAVAFSGKGRVHQAIHSGNDDFASRA